MQIHLFLFALNAESFIEAGMVHLNTKNPEGFHIILLVVVNDVIKSFTEVNVSVSLVQTRMAFKDIDMFVILHHRDINVQNVCINLLLSLQCSGFDKVFTLLTTR